MRSFETKLIHAGEPRPPIERAVSLPIFQSSTFEYGGEKDYNDIRYIRLNNTPNHLCLASKLAAIENGEAAQVAASGMAIISTTLLDVVGSGEHLLAQGNLYGGTYHFLEANFPSLNRQVSFFDEDHLDELPKLIKPNTKAIYVESVSNPLLKIPDLIGVVRFAKDRGLVSLIDNTFPSPFNFNPIDLGFDLILHSATKYLNGHTDIVGGCVVGVAERVRSITRLLNHLGGSMDPHTCFLLARGIKTLSVRMAWQNESARSLAQALEGHSRISRVIYPGLSSHPNHARAKEWFRGYGGMVSFEYLGDAKDTDQFLARLTIPYTAPSLGGVETLVTRPVTTSHSGISKSELSKLGIAENLVRVSVGLESTEDLITDFQTALG